MHACVLLLLLLLALSQYSHACRYHSGIGFFMNATLLVASVYLSLFALFVFALADMLRLDADRSPNPKDTTIPALNSIQIAQLGLLTVIPYWGELCLESGFLAVRCSSLFHFLFQACFPFRCDFSACF